MGSVKFTKYDRNRFRKTYPRFRVLPSDAYKSNGPMVIEAMEVEFTGTDKVEFQLAEDYVSAPTITATPYGEMDGVGGSPSSDILIWVESVTVTGVPPGGRKAVVVIRASVNHIGKVFVQAIKAG